MDTVKCKGHELMSSSDLNAGIQLSGLEYGAPVKIIP